MPKPTSCPILYDQCKTVNITLLKQWGYLKPCKQTTGVISWSNQYEKTCSISIRVITDIENGYLQLDYTSNGKPISYKVEIVSRVSNLGKGVVWYFICPKTRWHCRKLYLVGGYFYHRKAFAGCMYDKQTESRKNSYTGKLFNKWDAADKARTSISSKHFKKQYNARPTKRYLKHLKQIEAGKGITEQSLLMM